MMKKLLVSLTWILLASVSLFATDYKLDKAHSQVGFKIKHMMISTVNGSFGTYDGVISYDTEHNKLTQLKGTVSLDSINTQNQKRDKHLRSEDFFDVIKHPKMDFVMTRVSGQNLIGDLTIKGVTKSVMFALDFGGTLTDPWGNKRIGLTLTTEIKRSDFGLTWNKALETGGVVVADDVKIILELEGVAK